LAERKAISKGMKERLKKYLSGEYTQADKQYLSRVGILQRKEYTNTKILEMIKNKEYGYCVPKTCEWCGTKTLIIHKHHFPTPKIMGGTRTVNICPTCHTEYHLLESGNLELSDYGLSLIGKGL
jgi:hypothetical protein